jgi:DNA polymerase III delta prime subunit
MTVIKDLKMVEAAKKAWETRRKRQRQGYYEPKPEKPKPLTSTEPIDVDYPEDLELSSGLELPWVEKYRPVTLNGVLGTPADYLKAFVKTGSIPLAMVFYGDYGTGKTTAAKAFVRDYFVLRDVFQRTATFKDVATGRNFNSDLEGAWPPVLYVDATITGDIETIRSRVLGFMRVISIRGLPKFCIFDEADRLGFSAQGALRSLLEKYPNTRTIYTTNRIESIDEAIISRASGGVFEFTKPPVKEIVKYLSKILQVEKIRLQKSRLEEIAVASASVRESVGRLQQEAIVVKAKR